MTLRPFSDDSAAGNVSISGFYLYGVTLEQLFRAVNSQLIERRLLAQTHVEF